MKTIWIVERVSSRKILTRPGKLREITGTVLTKNFVYLKLTNDTAV